MIWRLVLMKNRRMLTDQDWVFIRCKLGFTREDVEYLRDGCMGYYNHDLADRIEALLPPEDT